MPDGDKTLRSNSQESDEHQAGGKKMGLVSVVHDEQPLSLTGTQGFLKRDRHSVCEKHSGTGTCFKSCEGEQLSESKVGGGPSDIAEGSRSNHGEPAPRV